MKAVCAFLLACPVLACDCGLRSAVCGEVASSGAVFIGTVESTAPSFMSRWYPLPRPALNQLNAADVRYLDGRSAENLSALKDAFRKLFPNLAEDYRGRIDNAATHAALVSVFTSVLDHGQRVHFRVRTVFRNGDDDDGGGGDDDAKPPESLDVWTPFGDCGVDFQPGETYLVYAAHRRRERHARDRQLHAHAPPHAMPATTSPISTSTTTARTPPPAWKVSPRSTRSTRSTSPRAATPSGSICPRPA